MNANVVPTARSRHIAATVLGLMLAIPAAAQQHAMQGMDMSAESGTHTPAHQPHEPSSASSAPSSSAHAMGDMNTSSMPGKPMPAQASRPGEVQQLHFGNMIGTRPKPGGLAESSHGMEMSSMGNMNMSSMQGGKAPPDARSPDYSDGYRYTNVPGMEMSDHAKLGMLLVDQMEYARDNHGGNAAFLDAEAWYGEDLNKLWLKAEGEAARGKLQDLRTEAAWNHAISAYWGTQLGLRQDFGEGPGRTWAAFGVQGLAPLWFNTEAEIYLGQNGRTAARVQLEYEEPITQRLVLQPKFEMNLYGKDDPRRGIGSGLADTELGLRLRYDIKREFGPYVGVVWRERYGRTATLARTQGQPVGELRFSAGLRFWF